MKVVPAVLAWKPEILRHWLTQPGRPMPVVVVANGTAVAFESLARGSRDHFFFTGQNYYFTGGWNRGIAEIMQQHPDVEYIWMCDDGTIGCTQHVLDGLVATMEQHADVAMMSPAVFGTPWPHMAPQRTVGFRYVPFIDHPAALLRVEAWWEIGPFDETFASYGNTEDWTVRARKARWAFGVNDAVTVEHHAVGDHGNLDWISLFEAKWGTRSVVDVLEGKIMPELVQR